MTTTTTARTETDTEVDLEAISDIALSAAIYEPFLWLAERLGMGERRKDLLAQARGRVLEIGAGTGLNLPHYPDSISELVLTEPANGMKSRIDLSRYSGDAKANIVRAAAEDLPFDDDTFDTVVSTMVLCTVGDPDRAVAEINRVLRPGGQLLFCEHIESDSPRLQSWQHRLAKPWAAFAAGCRCDRDTLATLRTQLEVGPVSHERWRAMPAIVRPLVVGTATAT